MVGSFCVNRQQTTEFKKIVTPNTHINRSKFETETRKGVSLSFFG
jgi:hypothetical protein